MKSLFCTAAIALMLSACAPLPNTSQTVMTRSLFTRSAIGGAGFPLVVSGAEGIGLNPVTVAQNLRFPSTVRAGSTFRAVEDSPALVNHAHLDIAPTGQSTLTFLHGDRRIGVGTFTLPREAYANPQALGSTSAALINDMLQTARSDRIDTDGESSIWVPY